MEEHDKKLSVCGLTACASLFFSEQWLIIPAKALFISSILITASNRINYLESPFKVTFFIWVRNVYEIYE
jgi:hypothetical protein